MEVIIILLTKVLLVGIYVVKLLPETRNYTVKYHFYLLLHPCPCNANNSASAGETCCNSMAYCKL